MSKYSVIADQEIHHRKKWRVGFIRRGRQAFASRHEINVSSVSGVSDTPDTPDTPTKHRRPINRIQEKTMSRNFNEIQHYANAEDEVTGDAYEIFTFPKVGNVEGEIRIARHELQNSASVLAKMIQKNADFDPCSKIDYDALATIINSKPKRMLSYSAKLGWNIDGDAFMTPEGALFVCPRDREPTPPLWLSNEHPVTFKKSGKLKGWKNSVAALSCNSSIAMFAIGCAFAAPLLHHLGLPTFGFNFYGRSKAGKTSALIAGCSVIGIGEESALTNWGATSAAKSEAARVFNDLIYPLNEVGLIRGSRARAYPEIREVIYNLSEGRDRLRHSQSQYSTAAAGAQYHTIFVSTAEHSFDSYAKFAGEKRDEGEYARCIDIPVDDADLTSIIDVEIDKNAKDRLKANMEDLVIRLREACRLNHGTAFKPYIKYVMKNKESVLSDGEKYIAEFERKIRKNDLKGALAHAARNFGVVYAGGRVAIESEVLPWKLARWRRAVLRCFNRAISKIDLTDPLEEGRALLKVKLHSSRVKARKSIESMNENKCVGYYDVIEGRKKYFVKAAKFRGWFKERPAVASALIEWLDEGGYLLPRGSDTGKVDRTRKNWETQTPKWPATKGSVRALVFWDPFDGEGKTKKK